ncbi:MAG: class I SAM-dependent methyltransferase [Nanoarchaeota archaeon]|nr:class I SAM-dependent methyltransferase [Nanoarchaeota archaeon]
MKTRLNFKTKKEFLTKYEAIAEDYDSQRSTTFEDKKVLKEQLNIINQIIKKNQPKKILEAGCGTGRILIPLTANGNKIDGFDLSKNMLNQLSKKDPKIRTKIGDIEKIPYKSDTYDLVYSITVLIHLTNFEKGFREMYRVAKKGGLVVFDLPNKCSFWTRLSLLFDPNKKRTRLYSLKELKEYFKGYEYQITGIFSYARTFYKIHVLRYIINFLDNYLKLPISQRTQFIVIVKKN